MGDLVEPLFKDLRNKPPKKRARINPISVKRRARIDAWQKVHLQLIAEGVTDCQACDVHHLPECSGRFEHKHHMRLKSQGGRDTRENCLPVGDAHHSWIHRNVAKARALGFIRGGDA